MRTLLGLKKNLLNFQILNLQILNFQILNFQILNFQILNFFLAMTSPLEIGTTFVELIKRHGTHLGVIVSW